MTTKSYDFCPCYCEENIYLASTRDPLNWPFVVFISNDYRQVAFGKQFSGNEGLADTVIWDYHVIACNPSKSLILDLNCSLGPQIEWNVYKENALIETYNHIRPRLYRVIPTSKYILSSDRSHMKIIENECIKWSSPPPTWSIIFNPEIGNNLQTLINMSKNIASLGCVMNEEEFKLLFK